jgi:hypothetical protein
MALSFERQLGFWVCCSALVIANTISGCSSNDSKDKGSVNTDGDETTTNGTIGNQDGESSGNVEVTAWPKFSSKSAVTTDATWGTVDAKLSISNVSNLSVVSGMYLAASVDEIPCTEAKMNEENTSVFELTCSIPPGNASKPLPKLSIKGVAGTTQGLLKFEELENGNFEVPVKECSAAATPTSGVALPQLCRPDAGSMALTGKKYEGLFTGSVVPGENEVTGFFFVASDGTYLSGNDGGSSPEDYMKMGKLVPSDRPWDPFDGYYCDLKDALEISGGTYQFDDENECKYIPYSGNSITGLSYSISNALAVTLSSVAGTWSNERSNTTFSISVDGDTGTISGASSYGEYKSCNYTGSIRLREPNSKKNLFDVSLTITNAAEDGTIYGCNFPNNSKVQGFAALHYRNIGTNLSPIYKQTLLMSAYETDKTAFAQIFDKQ